VYSYNCTLESYGSVSISRTSNEKRGHIVMETNALTVWLYMHGAHCALTVSGAEGFT